MLGRPPLTLAWINLAAIRRKLRTVATARRSLALRSFRSRGCGNPDGAYELRIGTDRSLGTVTLLPLPRHRGPLAQRQVGDLRQHQGDLCGVMWKRHSTGRPHPRTRSSATTELPHPTACERPGRPGHQPLTDRCPAVVGPASTASTRPGRRGRPGSRRRQTIRIALASPCHQRARSSRHERYPTVSHIGLAPGPPRLASSRKQLRIRQLTTPLPRTVKVLLASGGRSICRSFIARWP